MIDSSTSIYAVIGNPIKHSLSPKIHNAIFEKFHLNSRYCAFCIESSNIKQFISSMKTLGIKGVNVTVPYKEVLVEYLDKCDKSVQRCGAVNTIVNHDGVTTGYNTDGIGFIYVLEHVLNINLNKKNIVILGAGGTAKSIGFSFIDTEIASLSLLNRSKDNLHSLYTRLKSEAKSLDINAVQLQDNTIYDYLHNADIVINTTSLGMDVKDPLILKSMDWVSKHKTVIDVIYSPKETLFLKEARLRGANTLNGLAMLAAQAMFASHLFTQEKIDFEFVFKQLESHQR